MFLDLNNRENCNLKLKLKKFPSKSMIERVIIYYEAYCLTLHCANPPESIFLKFNQQNYITNAVKA